MCIANVTDTACPINPETLIGPASPTTTQLKVGVFVNNTDTFSIFDITLLADHMILTPAGANNNGVFAGASPISECIGGVQKVPSAAPCQSFETQDTIELTVLGTATPVGFTGLLFTAIYNITGSTHTTPIGFQTGCGTATSVPPLCITLASSQPVTETSQTGKFSNLAYYAMTTSVDILTVFNGTMDSSTILTLTSLNSFAGTVTLTTSVAPSGPNSPSASLAPTNITLASGGFDTAFLTVTVPSTANVGNYNVTLIGDSPTLPTNSVTIKLVVPPPDFVLTSSAGGITSSINMNATTSTQTTIIVTSTGGFSGTVNLQQSSSNPANMSTTLSVSSVTISSTTPGSSVLTITSPSDHRDYGAYTVNVTATSHGITHSIILKISVADFIITAPASITMLRGSIGGVGLIFSSVPADNAFFGQINLTETVPTGSGMTASCFPSRINFTRSGNTGTSPSCTLTASQAGTFPVTFTGTASITGTTRPLSHNVTVSVIVRGPDFSIAIPQNTFSGILASPSTSNSTTIIVSQQAAFNGTVTLAVSSTPTGPGLLLAKTVVKINSTFPSANVLLTIQTPATVPTGNYIITVTGTSGLLTHNGNVTLNVVDFTITASPTNIGPLLPSVTANVDVTIAGVNGFPSSVIITTVSSSGLTVSPSSKTITNAGTVTLTVSATNLGTYNLLAIATSGLVSHNVTITITVNARPDLAIASIAVNPASVTVGGTVTFTIVVQNLGAIPENATVSALIGDQTVATATVLLSPNTNQTVTLVWNTDGFSTSAYVPGAKVLQVSNEQDLSNNLMRSSTAFTLSPPSNTGLLSLSQDQSIYLLIGIIAIAVVIGVLLFRRTKPRPGV